MSHPFPIIEIDRFSGFCSGVNRAIKAAEEGLKRYGTIHSLGSLVHNEEEISRLRKLGMEFITHEEADGSRQVVFIRAHGEPPETYRKLEEQGAVVIDATCPVVLRLQHRIRESSRQLKENGSGQVVIFGKPGHPEIIGLLGQTEGNALLISKKEEAEVIDYSQPLHLFAQTTASEEEYAELCAIIAEKSRQQTGRSDMVTVTNSICRQMSRRVPELKAFAARHDVLIFVSGKDSSNGKYLSGIAREVNPETHVVAGAVEVENWFSGAASIGISGATSTPVWLMEEVAARVSEIVQSNK